MIAREQLLKRYVKALIHDIPALKYKDLRQNIVHELKLFKKEIVNLTREEKVKWSNNSTNQIRLKECEKKAIAKFKAVHLQRINSDIQLILQVSQIEKMKKIDAEFLKLHPDAKPLNHPLDIIDEESKKTALQVAIESNNKEVVGLLLEAKATPKCEASIRSQSGYDIPSREYSALEYAIVTNHKDVIDVLLKSKPDQDTCSQALFTTVSFAHLLDHDTVFDIVKKLLEAKATLTSLARGFLETRFPREMVEKILKIAEKQSGEKATESSVQDSQNLDSDDEFLINQISVTHLSRFR